MQRSFIIRETDLVKNIEVNLILLEEEPEPAFLRIKSDPSRARIFIDGRDTGET
ncbi:hypothetical protein LCGC14_2387880, partial [marine sediment metagenome]